MKKKGVELSMNLIIIAAIGLLILVILAVLVINSVSKTNNSMQSCNVVGGICQTGSCTSGDTISNGACASGKTCCKLVNVNLQTAG
jgi:hypothetical protein